MDGQEKLLDYETIKAAVAELPAGTRITIKRAAPSYAALSAITCTPPKQIHRCASVPVSGANNDCNLCRFGADNRQFQGFSRTFAEVGEYFILLPVILGMAAVILPIVLRRSALWYISGKAICPQRFFYTMQNTFPSGIWKLQTTHASKMSA